MSYPSQPVQFANSLVLRIVAASYDGVTPIAGPIAYPTAGIAVQTINVPAAGRLQISQLAIGATFGVAFQARADSATVSASVGVAVFDGPSVGQVLPVGPSLTAQTNIAFAGDSIVITAPAPAPRAIELILTPITAAQYGSMVEGRFADAQGADVDNGIQAYTVAADGALAPQVVATTIVKALAPVAALTLPTPPPSGTWVLQFSNAAGGNVTLTPTGGNTINGAATLVVADGLGATLRWTPTTSWVAA